MNKGRTEKLYLSNWEFNIAKVCNRLEQIITKENGYFISSYFETYANYTLINRNTNEEIQTHFRNYMEYVIDDVVYYFEINDNMFFDFHYSKYPISEYNYRHYAQNINKNGWCRDSLLNREISDVEVDYIANLLFYEMKGNEPTKLVKTRHRVYDRPHGRYHYAYTNDKQPSYYKMNILHD